MKKIHSLEFKPFIFVSLIMLLPSSAWAAPGDLDAGFGSGGVVVTDIGLNTTDSGEGVAIQSDGKIVVVGSTTDPTNGDDEFSVTRYNPDGTLDAAFNSGGIVVTDLGANSIDNASDVSIQPDGKIVVVGTSSNPISWVTGVALVRYNPDGSLDATFGTGGIVVDTRVYLGRAVAIQSDGKIVVAGLNLDNLNLDGEIMVARFNSIGAPDSGFGPGGSVSIDVGLNSDDDAYDVAIQADGKIVVAGQTIDLVNADSEFVLVRLDASGFRDATFGNQGIVITDFGTNTQDLCYALKLQGDGKIVAAGESTGPLTDGADFALARYNTNGSLDAGFGNSGLVLTSMEAGFNDVGSDVVIQGDGKIVVAGYTWNQNFALARYQPNGALDNGFGAGGIVISDLGTNTADYGRTVELQADGNIVVAGSTTDQVNGDQEVAVVRYIGLSPPIPDITANGQSAPLMLLMGAQVSIGVSLAANDLAGTNADLFVGALSPNGTYWMDSSRVWSQAKTPAQATFSGPLPDISPINALTYSLPWRGVYTFFMIVDTVGNNTFDNLSYLDTVVVSMGDTPPMMLSSQTVQDDLEARLRKLMDR